MFTFDDISDEGTRIIVISYEKTVIGDAVEAMGTPKILSYEVI